MLKAYADKTYKIRLNIFNRNYHIHIHAIPYMEVLESNCSQFM